MAGSEKLEWLMRLEDGISEPASKGEKRLAALERRLLALQKAEKETSDPATKKRLASRISSLGVSRIEEIASADTRHASAWKEAVDLGAHSLSIYTSIAGIVTSIADKMFQVASAGIGLATHFAQTAIEAGATKEQMIQTFSALLGGKTAAVEMSDRLDALIPKLSLAGGQVEGITRQLLGGGFAAADIPTYLTAISDAAAATGASTGQIDAATDALLRIRREGTLSGRALKALADVGVPMQSLYQQLAKDLGVTEAQAAKLAKTSKIKADEGLYAIVGAVATGRAGGKLGSVGAAYAEETFAGIKKNFLFFRDQMFNDVFASSGFEAFKGFWANVNKAMDPESATGRRIRERINDAFDRMMNGLFGPLTGESGLATIEAAANAVIRAVDWMVAGFRLVWGFVSGLASGWLDAFGVSARDVFGAGGTMDPARMETLIEQARVMGEMFGSVAAQIQKVADTLAGVGRLIDNVTSLADLGGGLLGRAQGISESIWAPRPATTLGAGGINARQSTTQSATVNVNVAGGATAADAETIGHKASEGVKSALETFENAAFALGILGD